MPDTVPPLDSLPYRPCVGIALFNPRGQVWIGRRIPDGQEHKGEKLWQLPQGGIDEGEEPRAALFRELHEETGLSEARVLSEIPDWLHYDFPEEVIAMKKFRNRGQKQKWFALLHEGPDTAFNLELHEPEFDQWRWVDLPEVSDLIIPFKRPVYEAIVTAFLPISERLYQGKID